MDWNLFEERILESVKDTLLEQKLNKHINLISLIETQERYYLLRATFKGIQKNLLFLRYGSGVYYIHGIHEIPKIKKRDYGGKRGILKNKVIKKIGDSRRNQNANGFIGMKIKKKQGVVL